MTTETAANKDTQKLQRVIVDGLEDVKAQDIKVFDTMHLSALFERVIIASGTSNRQTKALAASVRDAVRAAGFPKPRIEGEANGEWIIVDCAQAVVHIMQPGIRSYYHLEELWGDKPVRMKFGATKPAQATPAKAVLAKPAAKTASAKAATAKGASAKGAPAKGAPARAAPARAAPARARRKVDLDVPAAAKPAARARAPRAAAKSPARKRPAGKA